MNDRIRRELAEIAAEKARLDARARELIRLAAEEMARDVGLSPAETKLLITGAKDDTLDAVDASSNLSDLARSRARMSTATKRHPFVRAFMAAGDTSYSAAKRLGVARTTMQSWYRTGEQARPIPRAMVDKIAQLYEVPASVWTRITE